MPLDGLLAECEPESVPRVFFPVETLKHREDAALECELYTGTVVCDGDYPIEIFSSG